MAELSLQEVTRDGLNVSFVAASSGGDSLDIDGIVWLRVKNGDASAHTVTVASTVGSPPPGTTVNDVSQSIPAGEERDIGPFPKSGFGDSQRKASITYDAVTSMQIAALTIKS